MNPFSCVVSSDETARSSPTFQCNRSAISCKNRIVIHDLRLELNGRVAQIDHLVLNRLLEVYVLETKHFTEGVSINDQGEFSIWFGGKPRGIPSPPRTE